MVKEIRISHVYIQFRFLSEHESKFGIFSNLWDRKDRQTVGYTYMAIHFYPFFLYWSTRNKWY